MKDLKNMLEETVEFYREQERSIISALGSLPKGRIKKKKKGKRIYYYLQYRKEGKLVDEYIGKEVPQELLEALEKRKKLEAELRQVRQALKLLKEKPQGKVHFLKPIEKLFREFTQSGLWKEGLEVIGTWCFWLYQKYLSVPHYPLTTRDLNILIPLPYKGKEFDLSGLLKELGFSENFNPDGSLYFTGYGMKIEFLAPQRGKGRNKPPYIKELKVTPQILRFMDLLLSDSITLKVARGLKISLPSPSAFFFHKILVSRRRKEPGKAEKDLKQAVYVGKYILQNPHEKEKLLRLWKGFPPSWKRRIKTSLKEVKETLPLESSLIESLESLLH